jgi:hypothetical protein
MLHWSDRQEEFLRRVPILPILPILSILAELSLTAPFYEFTSCLLRSVSQ